MSEAVEITAILAEARAGDPRAMEKLIPIVYQDLRRLANYYMNSERPGHTLQATALVHEAYLRLIGSTNPDYRDRAHFFAAAAQVMRHLLVDHARSRCRLKRGAGIEGALDEALTLAAGQSEDVLAVHEALEQLALIDERQSRIVELRYFGGLSVEEITVVLGVSERTVKRDWQMAKAWLCAQLRGEAAR